MGADQTTVAWMAVFLILAVIWLRYRTYVKAILFETPKHNPADPFWKIPEMFISEQVNPFGSLFGL